MRFSYNWLKDFIDLDLPAEALAKHLLLLGFEVASAEQKGRPFSRVVAAEILKIEKHPNADRLSICIVTDGSQNFSVVCGAKNIQTGQKVPLARVGATVAGGQRIEKTKIRGAVSEGMLCSLQELGISEENPNGIYILPPTTTLGTEIEKVLPSEDTILDIDITPNRPDCLSHLGLARELSLYFHLPLKASLPFSHTPAPPAGSTDTLPIEIEAPQACPYYLGRSFHQVQVGPSPHWLTQRLLSVGLRPINNVVDITNYVLLELGHPLHAFDQKKLEGSAIRVRWAKSGENIKALDGRTYPLTSELLVIADASKPVAVAGIIGGEETSVTADTRTIFLEAATFSPPLIRKTAKHLKLKTESSYRFERGVDIHGVKKASDRAAELIFKCCGTPSASPSRETVPASGIERTPPIFVSLEKLNKILGSSIDPDRAEQILKSFDPSLKKDSPGNWSLTPPSYRQDIATVQDVAEEMGRLLGYDQIGTDSPPLKLQRIRTLPLWNLIHHMRETCVKLGLWEAYNYDFLSAEELLCSGYSAGEIEKLPKLENPLSSDWEYLRPTLFIGLLRNIKHNLNRGVEDISLFEIGKEYKTVKSEIHEETHLSGVLCGFQENRTPVNFSYLKGVVQRLLSCYPQIQWNHPSVSSEGTCLFHPKITLEARHLQNPVGRIGLLHPLTSKNWKFSREIWGFQINLEALSQNPSQRKTLKPFSHFPSIKRDLSFILPEEISWSKVLEQIRDHSPQELDSVELLDIFRGKGIPRNMKSLTVRFIFISPEKTLMDKEADGFMSRVAETLKNNLKARLRMGKAQ
ncbi:MAG: phenylalanine--tRNA ligase subunit beta [Elusimicrobia bacterium]|nr:phenylalanine--tRNA ligase subunit beta [Elusimicrobiota bacterium]